ncbi:neuropeptide F receptor [Brachionus plicatilis]|uniref:Neuropeptide F receptor n=1 Tax=Brachionus plicatilis TaxID=10195 RepID=A0A3M7S6C0_BRAPC|nr:neuropeptide F receptor [Brachionus plicatilis]
MLIQTESNFSFLNSLTPAILDEAYAVNDHKADLDLSNSNSKLTAAEEKFIATIFLAVIILGFFGNFLVVWTVLINKQMRTPNNLFILNLAISDLTLCVFSIPFNVYKTLRHTWEFGEFLCKFAPFFQATNVFVSTMSITAIALDRYVNIVCAMKVRQSNNVLNSYGPIAILTFIWVFAFILSSPLFFFNVLISLEPRDFNFNFTINWTDSKNELFENQLEQLNIHHCIEHSPFPQSRFIYSFASLMIQYTLPFLIVGIAYGSIWWKLRNHRNKLKHHQQNSSKQQKKDDKSESNSLVKKCNRSHAINLNAKDNLDRKNTLKKQENSRRLKMNVLLAFIAIIFAASWLPINLFNILSDTKNNLIKASHTYYMINAICILLGMSSAVSNPFLYGVLNENFKREYVKLLGHFVTGAQTCLGKKTTRGTKSRTDETRITEKANTIVKFENHILLKPRPIILVNNESINDAV